ncbi:hypothetical protein, partial [Roseibium sp. RKSG952]|uniref:hypothetical protein n=1 Tax=Roseibium sp. RKSG952 TaxID=2529384 RepID=UPI001AD93EE9
NRKTTMAKYRKKPVEIEAVQFTYPPTDELKEFGGVHLKNLRKARHPGAKAEVDIITLEDGSDGRAKHVATEGDWIIKGVKGELYSCKPDIFEATYERVVDRSDTHSHEKGQDPLDPLIAAMWRNIEEQVAEIRQSAQDTKQSIRKGARRTSHRFSL